MTNAFATRYGPWALVTGASDGIGAAMAAELAARGINLLLVARRAERLEALKDRLQQNHPISAVALPVDLGTESGVQTLIDHLPDFDIGLYTACAGFGTAGHFADNAIADELDMITVNCHALTALAHPIAQAMRSRRRGGIIMMSSIVAFQGVRNAANYAATKAFVQTLAEGLVAELRPYGVDVLSSAPGPVATGFASRADMKMGGAASAETVARATLRALGRKTTVRPGGQSKLLGWGLGTLPRPLRSRILGGIMTGMTKHRNA